MKGSDGYTGVAKFYDIFDNKPNIDFYLKIARNHHNILDIGSGTGRIALPLVQEGKQLTAVEPSADMIRIFKQKLQKIEINHSKINIIAKSATTFQVDTKFDLCIMSGVFDHLLSINEKQQALRNIANHLRPKGELIFDCHLGLMQSKPLRNVDEIRKGELTYQRFIKTRILETNLMQTTLIYRILQDGEVIEAKKIQSHAAAIDPDQITKLVQDTGYRIITRYGSYEFEPYNNDSDLMIVHAVKKFTSGKIFNNF